MASIHGSALMTALKKATAIDLPQTLERQALLALLGYVEDLEAQLGHLKGRIGVLEGQIKGGSIGG